jgi:hypothetical protein
MLWKDKRDMNLLTNMHHPPAEGNFSNEHGNALKPAIMQDYNRHTGYVDKRDFMTNTPPADGLGSGQELFFHLMDLTICNSYILLINCRAKLLHRDFQLCLVRDLLKEGGRVLQRGTASQETHQHFPLANWMPSTFCTGQTKGHSGGCAHAHTAQHSQ